MRLTQNMTWYAPDARHDAEYVHDANHDTWYTPDPGYMPDANYETVIMRVWGNDRYVIVYVTQRSTRHFMSDGRHGSDYASDEHIMRFWRTRAVVCLDIQFL